MWEFKITKSDLGYNLYRIREKDGIIELEWFQGRGYYTYDRNLAKTFYTLDSAISALVIQKSRGKTDTTSKKKSKFEDKAEKKSWLEY